MTFRYHRAGDDRSLIVPLGGALKCLLEDGCKADDFTRAALLSMRPGEDAHFVAFDGATARIEKLD
jgi:hypothetical protein